MFLPEIREIEPAAQAETSSLKDEGKRMSKRTLLHQNRLGLILALSMILLLLGLAIYYWNELIVRTNIEGAQDYIGLTLQALLGDPIGLLFYQTEGSAPFLKYFSIGIAWIWGSYVFQEKFKTYTYFWGNIYWCVYATAFIMIAWVYGPAMRHYGWYACYYHCYPGEEGTMDKISHFEPSGDSRSSSHR